MDQKSRKVSLQGVEAALDKLRGIVPETPLLTIATPHGRISAKLEAAQPMGAFKLRGAWHRLTDIDPARRTAGVVAFSSGNHAQGVAWAAQRLGMPALIVMPADTPTVKLEGTRALGAEIVTYDRMTEKREEIAARIAAERGAVLVPSFDDPWVVEGQGTTGLEAMKQMGCPPALIVTPCGGGGLAAGLTTACPDARLIIVEPEGWDDMGDSLRAGEIMSVQPDPPPTACDALQTLRVAELTFGILRDRAANGVSVSEAETRAAMRFAWAKHGVRLEPGGAVALAAVLAGKVAVAPDTLVILSGGNVDPGLFEAVIND